MKFTSFTCKMILINMLFISMPILGLFYGLTQQVFVGDQSHMTIIISFLLVSSAIYTLYDSFYDTYNESFIHLLKFLSKTYLFLGLIGTVIGLSILVHYLKINPGDSPEQALNGMISNISIALNSVFFATLLGLVAKVWTETNIFFINQREYKNYKKA